jgi:hypothetical protein
VGAEAGLAHPDQRAPHLHQRQQVQGPLQGGVIQLGPTGTVHSKVVPISFFQKFSTNTRRLFRISFNE